MLDDRTASDSRCCQPADVPYEWRDFVDESHYAVAEFETWFAELARFARENELGRIDELFEAAAAGDLIDVADDATTRIKPVRYDPELWELRHKALSMRLRFYHAEPPSVPHALIKLHRHIKSDITDQQEQIEYAAERYRISDETDWTPA